MPLVRAMARRYGGRGEELEDLVQVGALGLVKASARFDPARGVAFASFAAPAVEGEIRRHLSERTGGMRLPRHKQKLSSELKRCQSELTAALGRSPTVAELAVGLDADEREVERLIAAALARDPVAIPADGTADELPADQREPTAESEHRVLLAGGLRALDERERRIVFLRFNADMTERQIARTLGISQAHVSRLLDGALSKLRAALATTTDDEGAAGGTESTVISPQPRARIDPVRAQAERGAPKATQGKGSRAEGATAPTGGSASQPGATPARRSGKGKGSNGYSGRILVRMPSELHEQLAQAAEREDVSLNRYVTQALSNSVDPESAADPDREGDRAAEPDREGDRAAEPDREGDRAAEPDREGDRAAEPDRQGHAGEPERGPEPPPEPERAATWLGRRSLRLALATNFAIVVVAAVVAVVLLVLAVQRGI